MLESLDRGNDVVLEFCRFGRHLEAYVLVANILTRRIHDQYVRRTEEALGGRGREPTPLVIVIEEAHRFLQPQVASQTVFGAIAREMRKYHVTLLVVDQRPSQIDSEVMSQLGTKVACLLDDERDVEAVLAGAAGGRELRGVLAGLETRQQALIFGHALPMPVLVRVRDYGTEESYTALVRRPPARSGRSGDDLFG
jgi:DNA helicase HerA-like ATPase